MNQTATTPSRFRPCHFESAYANRLGKQIYSLLITFSIPAGTLGAMTLAYCKQGYTMNTKMKLLLALGGLVISPVAYGLSCVTYEIYETADLTIDADASEALTGIDWEVSSSTSGIILTGFDGEEEHLIFLDVKQ